MHITNAGGGFLRTFERIETLRISCGEIMIEVEHNGESLDVITTNDDGEREAVLSYVLRGQG